MRHFKRLIKEGNIETVINNVLKSTDIVFTLKVRIIFFAPQDKDSIKLFIKLTEDERVETRSDVILKQKRNEALQDRITKLARRFIGV